MLPDAPDDQLVAVLSTSQGDMNKAVTLVLEGTVILKSTCHRYSNCNVNVVCCHTVKALQLQFFRLSFVML